MTAQDVTPELAKGFGVPRPGGAVVIAVAEGGPARAAGLRPGDVIVDIGDKSVPDARAMIRTIALMHVGRAVDLTIWRDHLQQTLTVTLAGWPNMESPVATALAPQAIAAMVPAPDRGLKLAVLTEAARQKLGGAEAPIVACSAQQQGDLPPRLGVRS